MSDSQVFDLRLTKSPPVTSRPVSAPSARPWTARMVSARRSPVRGYLGRPHDSLTGLDSPSYSRKGSFGTEKMLKVFDFKYLSPGPGAYDIRYSTFNFPRSSWRTMNWGRIAGWLGVLLTYSVYSVSFYFFVYRLGWRWFWTADRYSAAIILYPTVDIAVRILMGVWCHLYCMFGDAGIVQRPQDDRVKKFSSVDCEDELFCKKCDSSRPPRTFHCSTCNACIHQMDHHCPWINNCVGLGNQKAFLLFLAYTSSAAIECLGLAGLRLVSCPSVYRSVMVLGLRFLVGEGKIGEILSQTDSEPYRFDETCDFTIDYAVVGIIGIVFAAIFTVFIAFIASDQIQSIVRNETYIESLKACDGKCEEMKKHTPIEIGERLREVMGSDPGLFWLLPMRSKSWKEYLTKPGSDDARVTLSAPVRGS